MGAKQSRVVTSEVAAELRPEDEHERETRASIHLTPALIDQINGTHNAPKKVAGGLDAQQQAIFKKQMQMAYAKGADDYRKKMEAELKQKEQQASTSAPSLAQQAQFAKEQEERENERVEQLVAEINKKKYHEKSDVLKCKEVADAFVRCARQNTEKFAGEN
ncbi:hypothetical protein JG688_00010004 [Phytophthora aleatoria]|uniref:Uncharacterized protein n=1 Tax=Phytophthora aleatoria TaxID=2496075 RepID=A0A8J5MFT7_9STRA|nr:hypothetical protein JG688_00010004 [Phytophthora aleatoria]